MRFPDFLSWSFLGNFAINYFFCRSDVFDRFLTSDGLAEHCR
jgi:hypothetical protein